MYIYLDCRLFIPRTGKGVPLLGKEELWQLQSIVDSKRDAFDVILWNIFPFHSYNEELLTNRTPSSRELAEGITYLNMLLDLAKDAAIITIGVKSHQTLSDFEIKHGSVPHPANGGATNYRQQIAKLL